MQWSVIHAFFEFVLNFSVKDGVYILVWEV